MTKLTEEKFQEQIDQVIRIVNENHERYQKEQRLRHAIDPYSLKKKKIISQMGGYKTERISKKTIKNLILTIEEELRIKNKDQKAVGKISITAGFKEKVRSKFKLVDNKPIFIIYRGNEIYLQENIKEDKRIIHFAQGDVLKEVTKEISESRVVVDQSKVIYELIENKDYSVLDNYITNFMAQIIENKDLSLTPIEVNNIHTKLQVQYRDIQRTKSELLSSSEVSDVKRELLKKLDNLYMIICTTIMNIANLKNINLNFFEEEKIARG